LEQEVRRERIASLKDLLRSDCLLDPPPPILAGAAAEAEAALLVAFSIFLNLRKKRKKEKKVNPSSNLKQIQTNRLEKQLQQQQHVMSK
jgi:hypothetical protein